ncbi:MAG: hypothetical protein LBF93_04560 [Zoogloeaceae bacterium]|jgi:hypothetical protein|nr:hypothetical protein [Zoogloeaceae bacterium]
MQKFSVLMPLGAAINATIQKALASQNARRQFDMSLFAVLAAFWAAFSAPLRAGVIIGWALSIFLAFAVPLDGIDFGSRLMVVLPLVIFIYALMPLGLGFVLRWKIVQAVRDGTRRAVQIEKMDMQQTGMLVLTADHGAIQFSMFRDRGAGFSVGMTLDVLLDTRSSTALILGKTAQTSPQFKGI